MFLVLGAASGRAQDEPGPAGAEPVAEPSAAEPSAVEARLTTLEQELAKLRAEHEQDEERSLFSGWQLQLRGGWFTLAHNHRNNVFSRDDHQHGWSAGVAFMMPLWNKVGGGPIDLAGHLIIDYRQIAYSDEFVAPITGQQGTANYLNVIAGPVLRLSVSDVVRPFVFLGANMQVASPPQDPITYLDLGFALGIGVDFKLHDHVSVGLDYKYTWFGVADQEDEDYGQLGMYVGFNF